MNSYLCLAVACKAYQWFLKQYVYHYSRCGYPSLASGSRVRHAAVAFLQPNVASCKAADSSFHSVGSPVSLLSCCLIAVGLQDVCDAAAHTLRASCSVLGLLPAECPERHPVTQWHQRIPILCVNRHTIHHYLRAHPTQAQSAWLNAIPSQPLPAHCPGVSHTVQVATPCTAQEPAPPQVLHPLSHPHSRPAPTLLNHLSMQWSHPRSQHRAAHHHPVATLVPALQAPIPLQAPTPQPAQAHTATLLHTQVPALHQAIQ